MVPSPCPVVLPGTHLPVLFLASAIDRPNHSKARPFSSAASARSLKANLLQVLLLNRQASAPEENSASTFTGSKESLIRVGMINCHLALLAFSLLQSPSCCVLSGLYYLAFREGPEGNLNKWELPFDTSFP